MGKVNLFNFVFNMGLTHPPVFILNSLISFIVSTISLTAGKPNCVIVSVPNGDIGLGAIMACKLVGAKCVVDYRDAWEDYAISRARIEETGNIIRTFNCGLVARDWNEFELHLKRLYRDREFAKKLGENGRRAAEKYFNYELLAEALFEKLVKMLRSEN